MISAIDSNNLFENTCCKFPNKEFAKYDMIKTKENVVKLISQYKEAKYSFFASNNFIISSFVM